MFLSRKDLSPLRGRNSTSVSQGWCAGYNRAPLRAFPDDLQQQENALHDTNRETAVGNGFV